MHNNGDNWLIILNPANERGFVMQGARRAQGASCGAWVKLKGIRNILLKTRHRMSGHDG